MDAKILDSAMDLATSAARKALEYKAETYFAVLLSALLGSDSARAASVNTPIPPPENRPSAYVEKKYSAAELFASRTWSTEIEKVTLAGYFLERQSQVPSYRIADIRNCLISAKVALPANVNLAVLKAVQKGWMMQVPSEGEKHKTWALTQTGERKVSEMSMAQ